MKPTYDELLAILTKLVAEIDRSDFDGMKYEYFAGIEVMAEAREVLKRAAASK